MNEPNKSELNRLMAEKVFKCAKVIQVSPRRWAVRYNLDKFPSGQGCGGFKCEAEAWNYLEPHIPNPCENPADAMAVLKKCHEYTESIESGYDESEGFWLCKETPLKTFQASAPTLELAICLFAKQLFQ